MFDFVADLLQSLFVVDALIRHGMYLGEKRRKTNILEKLCCLKDLERSIHSMLYEGNKAYFLKESFIFQNISFSQILKNLLLSTFQNFSNIIYSVFIHKLSKHFSSYYETNDGKE